MSMSLNVRVHYSERHQLLINVSCAWFYYSMRPVSSYSTARIVSALIELPVANVEMAFFKLLGLQLRGGSAKQPNAIKSD